MSKFDELLKQPLPSKRSDDNVTTESEVTDNKTVTEDEITIDTDVSSDLDKVSDDDSTIDSDDINDAMSAGDDEDDFNPDDMSDEELEDLDKELTGETMDEILGKDEAEETLSPEEEIQADDLMQTAATALLVNDELSTEEKVALVNNEAEVNTIINEGFMRESDFDDIAVNTGLVEEKQYRRLRIEFDAATKKKQLYALAVNVSAAAHHDPDYKKYKKVLKLRKILKTKLERKYRAEANKRMRVYYKRLTKSASPTLNKLGAKG